MLFRSQFLVDGSNGFLYQFLAFEVHRIGEVEELARPCLNMLNRLTYEVTEIALDLPGINLEF